MVSGCGPEDLAKLGLGGDVIINNPAPAPAPTPTPTPASVTPAADCPNIPGLTNDGTITGPEGTWRVCTLPARITQSITLPKVPGLLYQLAGRVDVGTDGGFTAGPQDTNVTLSIDPGVIIFGGTGVSWLVVNRGNKINAVGTKTRPIIFTSRDNVVGRNNDNSSQQWGGVVLLGRARVTDCSFGSTAAGTCERQLEGAADPALSGGANDNDDSGIMEYVQIRYSGFVLGANSELQSLTPSAVGSRTRLNYIMSFNSSDDGMEIFGGVVNMKYFISVGAEDDSFDVDTGARANIQYAIAVQRQVADSLMEIDSNGLESDLPRTDLKIANATMIAGNPNNSNDAALLYRGNADITLVNSVIISPNNECLRIHNNFATAAFRSTVMQCNAAKYLDTGSAAPNTARNVFGHGSNNNNDSFSPTLTALFINGANENGVTAFDAKTLSTFFDTTTYIGAVRDSADTWYTGWTCNSSIANFGTGNSGLCTALPTT
ncbi:MAG: hypothetical protein N2423_04500 [Novosphingobium sp.]|nr:hypothetical protein [Novosphingobium sp.]